ncbi:MAG: GspH/FimT family pseudopilin [Betaproteobacteria bacterium]
MNQPSSLTRPGNHGFTLIELIVTMAILGVLLSVTIPSLTDLIGDSRLSTHTDILVVSLNTARLEAVRQRKDFQVCPSTTPDTGSTCSGNATDWASGWIIKDANADVVQRVQAKTGITLSTQATAVTFRGTLGSSNAVTSFTLCAPGRLEQQVDIALSGHIRKSVTQTLCT